MLFASKFSSKSNSKIHQCYFDESYHQCIDWINEKNDISKNDLKQYVSVSNERTKTVIEICKLVAVETFSNIRIYE